MHRPVLRHSADVGPVVEPSCQSNDTASDVYPVLILVAMLGATFLVVLGELIPTYIVAVSTLALGTCYATAIGIRYLQRLRLRITRLADLLEEQKRHKDLATFAADAKEAELQSEKSQLKLRVEQLENVLNSMPIGIVVSEDPLCRDVRINPEAAVLFGAPRAGLWRFKFLHDEEASNGPAMQIFERGCQIGMTDSPLAQAASHNMIVENRELDILRPDGGVCRVLSFAAPLVDPRGRVKGAVGLFFDKDKLRVEFAAFPGDHQRPI